MVQITDAMVMTVVHVVIGKERIVADVQVKMVMRIDVMMLLIVWMRLISSGLSNGRSYSKKGLLPMTERCLSYSMQEREK